MKFLLVAFLIVAQSVQAQSTWSVDKTHAKVGFTVTHLLLSETDGNFKTFNAKLTATKADLSDAVFELTADISSINTDNERRDEHLQGADFFDAARYPTLTFKSSSFTKTEGKTFKLAGNLTMRGVTKPISLTAVLTGPITANGPHGKEEKVGLKVSGVLNRMDFGVGKAGSAIVSEEVLIHVNGEFARQ